MRPVDQFFLDLETHQRPLAEYISGKIQRWYPHLILSIKYNTLFFSGNKNICYFNVQKTGVDVGFIYGNALEPRPEFIKANRKQVVSLFFDYTRDVDENLLETVLAEAVNLDRQDVASGKR